MLITGGKQLQVMDFFFGGGVKRGGGVENGVGRVTGVKYQLDLYGFKYPDNNGVYE